MSELESLALLIADLNGQVRTQQKRITQLEAERDDLLHRADHAPE